MAAPSPSSPSKRTSTQSNSCSDYKTLIKIDFSTSGPLGAVRKSVQPLPEVVHKRHDSLASDTSDDLAVLLRQPEMAMLLRGRMDYARIIKVDDILVSLTDERFPELISGIPHLRTTWTYTMVDPFRYDIDDYVLREAMKTPTIAVCGHLVARSPDGYGDASPYLNWPVRQPEEECVPDDGFRLSVRCKSCDATYSVNVVSTKSPHWDGSCEPYVQVNSWRPI